MECLFRVFFPRCIVSLLILISTYNWAGTASNVINFKAEFVGGSCDISVPPSIQFNDGNILLSSDIVGVSEAGTPKTTARFNITLSNCFGAGLTPKIKILGEKTTAFGSTLFRSASLLGPFDSDGYGVYLRTDGNETFARNVNMGFYDTISTKDWSVNNELNSISTVLPVHAVLRCGTCRYENRQGGKFIALVTFDFIYE